MLFKFSERLALRRIGFLTVSAREDNCSSFRRCQMTQSDEQELVKKIIEMRRARRGKYHDVIESLHDFKLLLDSMKSQRFAA